MSNSRRNLRVEHRALGLGQPISRRDFLNSTLIASGALLTSGVSPAQLLSQEDWTGYGGVGDYSSSNGNTYSIVQSGHGIRNGDFETLPAKVIDTGETYDCVIVGGGISGLAAALFFMRQSGSGSKCLVLDNHPIFGGEAKRNEFMVDGQRLIAHQGSAVFLRIHRTEFPKAGRSNLGRRGFCIAAKPHSIRHGRKRTGQLRILLWREVWPETWSVVDRSMG